MATLADAGALAERLGVDLRRYSDDVVDGQPTIAPCRCAGEPLRFEPDRCFTCGRFLDHAIGELYEEQEGPQLLMARIEVERMKLLREFTDSGAEDYEAWLEARLYATEKSLEKLSGPRVVS